jgi:hypothetical protein
MERQHCSSYRRPAVSSLWVTVAGIVLFVTTVADAAWVAATRRRSKPATKKPWLGVYREDAKDDAGRDNLADRVESPRRTPIRVAPAAAALSLMCLWSVGTGRPDPTNGSEPAEVRSLEAPAASPGDMCSVGVCATPVTNRIVLFGGWSGTRDLNDTWTFNGSTWTQVPVSSPPPERMAASLATLGDQLVLFGGCNGGGCGPALSDTWTFDASAWAEVPVASPPPARMGASLATLGSELVLFGGSGRLMNDTWMFSGTTWTQVSVSSAPPRRVGGSMATLGNEVVLFGGAGPLNDTWTFDGSTWTQVSIPNPPPARQFASIANLGSRVVLFGGLGRTGRLNDTWTFDGSRWTQVSISNPPPARQNASSANLGGQVVLFGGFGGHHDLNDTWTFDGTRWTQVSISNPPPARDNASMAVLP